MKLIGTTPYFNSHTAIFPSWKEYYYQIKKEGYSDSKIIRKGQSRINEHRRIRTTLDPIPEKKTSPILEPKPEPLGSPLTTAVATTISIRIDSNPSAVKVYEGTSPTNTQYIGITPFTWSFTGINPYWPETYYVFSKEGYSSKTIFAPKLPVHTNREMSVTLDPIPEKEVSFQLESNPPHAVVYGGPTPTALKYFGIAPGTKSGRPDWYFQFKKEGFQDSEIIHAKQLPGSTVKTLSVTLIPILQPKVSPPPSQNRNPKSAPSQSQKMIKKVK